MSLSPVQNPPSPSSRAPGLDLLRAVAIVVVMLYHLSSHGIDIAGPGRHGWMGVDLFFVLSGYLIGWQVLRDVAAGRMPDWTGFILGRAWRILPAYLAVLALYLVLPAWREAEAMPPVWQFLTFTMNVLPDHLTQRAYSHAWSLCVEEHFYLLMPLAVWLLARRGKMPGARALALLAYSLYLTHRQVYAWLDGLTGDLTADAPVAGFVLYNAAALAVAALLYAAVERPGLRLRARMLAIREDDVLPLSSRSSQAGLR